MIARIRTGVICLILILVLQGYPVTGQSAETPEIRVGVLKFGTVNWELDTLRHNGFDRQAGFKVTIVPFASPRATQIALLGGAVDVIVGDWVWVSRQRYGGEDVTFIPYSTSVGAVVVPAASSIKKLEDIDGRKVGVAGGPIDKNWLIAKAYLSTNGRAHVADGVERTFGAPPLLSQLLLRGEIDAVFTYWHYAARLQAAGLRRLVGIGDLATALGVLKDVPLLGYIFHEDWAERLRPTVRAFAAASRQTKQLLAAQTAPWTRLRPLMRADTEETAALLRAGYVAGIPQKWGKAERAAADDLYAILADSGGRAFSDGRRRLAPGTFWADLTY